MPLPRNARLCGAKTRAGGICQNVAMKNGKCRLHGGKSTGAPKGNQNSATPGSIYSKFLTDEENEVVSQEGIDSLESEIKLYRARLYRLVKLEQEQGEMLELNMKTTQTPVVGGLPIPPDENEEDSGLIETNQYAKRDYSTLINQTTARLQSLIQQRNAMLGQKLDLEVKQLNLEILRNKESYSSSVLSVSPTVIELVAPVPNEG